MTPRLPAEQPPRVRARSPPLSSSACGGAATGASCSPSATTRSPRGCPGLASGRSCVALYIISALLAALAGFLVAGLIKTATITLVERSVLPSVAAAVIGGTSIMGGRGGYSGTIVGALILTVLTTLLTVLEMPEAARQMLFGLDHRRRRRRLHAGDRRVVTRPTHLGIDLGVHESQMGRHGRARGRRWTTLDRGQVADARGRGPRRRRRAHRGDRRRRPWTRWPDVVSVGIGVPGLYDPVTGSTRFLVNMPGDWSGRPVAQPIAARPRHPGRADQRRPGVRAGRAAAGRRARCLVARRVGAGHRRRRRHRRRRPGPPRARRDGRRDRPPDDRPERPIVRLRQPRLSRGVRPGATGSPPHAGPTTARRPCRRPGPAIERALAGLAEVGPLPRHRHRQHDRHHLARSGRHRRRRRGGRRPAPRPHPGGDRGGGSSRHRLDAVEIVTAELGTWAGAIGAGVHGAEAAAVRWTDAIPAPATAASSRPCASGSRRSGRASACPSDAELQAEFGVSRMTARNAMQRLDRRGPHRPRARSRQLRGRAAGAPSSRPADDLHPGDAPARPRAELAVLDARPSDRRPRPRRPRWASRPASGRPPAPAALRRRPADGHRDRRSSIGAMRDAVMTRATSTHGSLHEPLGAGRVRAAPREAARSRPPRRPTRTPRCWAPDRRSRCSSSVGSSPTRTAGASRRPSRATRRIATRSTCGSRSRAGDEDREADHERDRTEPSPAAWSSTTGSWPAGSPSRTARSSAVDLDDAPARPPTRPPLPRPGLRRRPRPRLGRPRRDGRPSGPRRHGPSPRPTRRDVVPADRRDRAPGDPDRVHRAGPGLAARPPRTMAPSRSGFNLEGPFLSEARKGAHDPRYLRDAGGRHDATSWPAPRRHRAHHRRPGAARRARSHRRPARPRPRVSMGHCAATLDEAQAGYAAGGTTTTHLFNAMVGVDHRAPGLAVGRPPRRRRPTSSSSPTATTSTPPCGGSSIGSSPATGSCSSATPCRWPGRATAG